MNNARLSPTLPLLDALHARLGDVDGSIRTLFGLQHLFGSTASLVRKIAKDRIAPDDVYLLGKPYSANYDVVRFLRADLGYRVHRDSCHQPLARDNDGEMDHRIATVLQAIRRRLAGSGGRVLLIDDGGRAIRLLHTPSFADIRDRFTCVEQTRCGIRTLEDLDLRVPVVNVAESWVKLEYESPMIADSIRKELCTQLATMEAAGLPTGKRALVVGYGAIGAAVAAEMRRRGRHVAVHDENAEQRAIAQREGYATFERFHTALGRGGVIIGCTGKPVLDRPDHERIPDGTILVSASSADVEFRAWQLRPGAECLGRPQAWSEGSTLRDCHHPCFSLYRIQNGRGQFYLVNGGFPVNFNGGVDPIAPERIQLTRSLLFIGAHQASRTMEPGLHELDASSQQMLLDNFTAPGDQRAA